VVCVERVAQAERVGEATERKKAGMLGAVSKQQAPTGDMEKADRPKETAEADALTPIEGASDQSPGRGHR
jgi:hypothetical protein